MKKNSQRKPKPRTQARAASATVARRSAAAAVAVPDHVAPDEAEREERKVGVISGTPADAFDEMEERKRDRWVAIYISVLAVLIAIAATASNDAMKSAQQAGFRVNDLYAYYQAKTIRQSQIQIASRAIDLKMAETPNLDALPESMRKLLLADKAEFEAENKRLDSDGKNGKKELLAKAESCENERNFALAQHPFYDYSMAMLQIAIVLASASIITGARLLLVGSGIVGVLGVFLFINGYALFFGAPSLKHDKADALEKAGVHISLQCLQE